VEECKPLPAARIACFTWLVGQVNSMQLLSKELAYTDPSNPP
jgi:hypothetical protein